MIRAIGLFAVPLVVALAAAGTAAGQPGEGARVGGIRDLMEIVVDGAAPAEALPEAALPDEEILARLDTLLSEAPRPAAARFAVSIEGCILTRSILHHEEQVCGRGPGGWYRADTVIDLRLVRTSPAAASVITPADRVRYNFESIAWPVRSSAAARHRAMSDAWRPRSLALIDADMALPHYDLARRMDRLRALADELFPDRRFAGLAERVAYCGAGTLESPLDLAPSGAAQLPLVRTGSGREIVDLVHVYASRHCGPALGFADRAQP